MPRMSKNPALEASDMLAAALEQMDGILAGGWTTLKGDSLKGDSLKGGFLKGGIP